MSQRAAEGVVDSLSTGVGRDLGRQACQQPSQRLGAVALQAEEVLELADHPLDDLALACAPYSSSQRRSHSTPVNPLSARYASWRSDATRASPMGLSSEEAGARKKALTTPLGSTTSATLNP